MDKSKMPSKYLQMKHVLCLLKNDLSS